MGLRQILTRRETRTKTRDQLPLGVTVEQVRKYLAEQAHGEVMRLQVGQRLVIEHFNSDNGPQFSIAVESIDHFPRVESQS